MLSRRKRILFVSECRLDDCMMFNRSYYADSPEYAMHVAGMTNCNNDRLTKDALDWATKIYTVDLSQYRNIEATYGRYNIENIGVPNQEKAVAFHEAHVEFISLMDYWFLHVKNREL